MASLSPRLRLLIAVSARLVLVVIALQIAALDHHFGFSDVVGVEGSSAHTLHCHGDSAGCADSGSGAVLAIEDAFTLPREVVHPLAIESTSVKPAAVVTPAAAEPPRL